MVRRGNGSNQVLVWNFPLNITFHATNPYGWPQIIVALYGLDVFGRDVIRGYGALHLPLTSGSHTLFIRCFTPRSSSILLNLQAWLTGARPEFMDPRLPAKGDGREVVRVVSDGTVKVVCHMVVRDLQNLGYSSGEVTRTA
jgi:B9 domain-containing protein 1